MLSDQERRALAETEEVLRRQDGTLARAFDDFALIEPGHQRGLRTMRERTAPMEFGPETTWRGQLAATFAQLALIVVVICLIGLTWWAVDSGPPQLGVLMIVVSVPLIALFSVTVMALSARS